MSDSKGLCEPHKKAFKKRPGSTNRGIEYEHLLIALSAVSLSEDGKINDFQLSSNDEQFGKFDDVVLEYEYKNKKKNTYAIQMKHRNEERKLTAMSLASKKGAFSIQQYFESYQEIKQRVDGDFTCILYTNLKYEFEPGFEFELEDHDFKISIHECSSEETFLNTSENGLVYKFKVVGASSRIYQDFLNHFFLYANQRNTDEMKILAGQKLEAAYYSKDIFLAYMDSIVVWSQREGKKECLNKKTTKTKISEILLRTHLNKTTPIDIFDLDFFKKCCIFYDIIVTNRNFHFSLFDLEEDEVVRLWHKHQVPLIVRIDENNRKSVYKAIKVFEDEDKKMKFVLISDNFHRVEFEKFQVLQNLNDLSSDQESYTHVIKNKMVSVQGREPVVLETIIDTEISKAITIDELLNPGLLKIGENKEELPKHHIKQFVSKPIVSNLQIFDDLSSLKIVVSKGDIGELKNFATVTTEEFLKEEPFVHQKFIVVAENGCTEEVFTKICQKVRTKKCHLFSISTSMELEWIRSNGDNMDIRKYLVNTDLPESEIFHEDKLLNIISGKPGAGKSVMLKSLKNTIPSKYWTVKINFRDHVTFYRRKSDEETIVKYFLDFQCEAMAYDAKTLNVRQSYKDRKKIVFLWDGFDELPKQHWRQAIQTIQKLKELGYINWITTRDSLAAFLEHNLQVLSLTIKEMDRKLQEEYIRKQLNTKQDSYDNAGLETVIQKIADVIALTRDATFFGIALRLYMLTDLFLKNPEKCKQLLKSTIIFPEIIHHFVREQFMFCYRDKGDYDFKNNFINKALEGNIKYRLMQYEVLALKMFLPPETLESLPINYSRILEDFEEDSNDFGLVVNGGNFVHEIYGEFFVAVWMAKNFHQVKNFKNFIFRENYRNIRIMFDLILVRGCPAHIAVLNKDFSSLAQYKDHLELKDKAGRSPLHLACSWGQAHPLLEEEIKKEVHILKNAKKADLIKIDDADYKNILNFLVRHCDPLQKDELFGWSSVDYADGSLSLFSINLLLETTTFSLESLQNFRDSISLAFYCIKFNYIEIFKKLKKFEYIVDECSGNSLLHLAVAHDRNQFLEKIFANNLYLQHINETNYIQQSFPNAIALFRDTPLHLAVGKGNIETIQILAKKGARLDSKNIWGQTSLHVALKANQPGVAEFLLDRGADVNLPDLINDTALNYATAIGNLKLVKKVLQKGPTLYKNSQNLTAIDIATALNRIDILDLLIQKGIPTSNFSIKELMVAPLFTASQNGQVEAVHCFLKNRANVNHQDYTHKNATPLFTATFNGHLPIVQLLLEAGANPNVETSNGLNALSYAVLGQHVDIVELLIQKAKVVSFNDNGLFSLIQAIIYGNKEIVTILLNNGVDVNKKHVNGCSPMHFAAFRGIVEIIELLLKHKADMNVINNKGGTPLHVAAYHCRNDVLEFLIRRGGDINIKALGFTPLTIAALMKRFKAVPFPPTSINVEINVQNPMGLQLGPPTMSTFPAIGM